MVSDGNVQADTEKVAAATDFMILQLVEFATQNKLSMIDVFMVAHNIHKKMTADAAITWSKNGMSASKVYRMADMTFRKAMRELNRL